MVFAELGGQSAQQSQQGQSSKSAKSRQRGDLEDEFGMSFQPNEGEAAEHGVFFDDTRYDYMQHMKDLGRGGGEVTWVDASKQSQKEKKGKGKMKLEDALREMEIGDEQSEGGVSLASERSLLPSDVMPSEFVKKTTYQDQQNIPDALAGFQPDMDPRLREVLEALEDEAYVDNEDDFFDELAEGEELDEGDWEAEAGVWEDDEGWESDHTIKPDNEDTSLSDIPLSISPNTAPSDTLPPNTADALPPADPTEGAWLAEFTKYKQATKTPITKAAAATPSAMASTIDTGLSSLASGRRKKRKGAKTSTTNYSMTSSALARTDTQTILDARFDRLLVDYDNDRDLDTISEFDDESLDGGRSMISGMTGMSSASKASKASAASNLSKASGMSGMSRASGISSYSRATDLDAPQLVRTDFDNIMDGFLESHSVVGRKGFVRKGTGKQSSGMEMLDEVRKGLGPARVGPRTGRV